MNRLDSGLHWRDYGKGEPVTLVAHGLGATDGEARIPASGLPGTRVVARFPSHGGGPDAPASYWHYPTLADELATVADEVGATRAVGVSLGAGALTALLAARPDRFVRAALLLPAALDRPRTGASGDHVLAMSAAADRAADGDPTDLRALVAAALPPGARVGAYLDERTTALTRLAPALRVLADQAPLTSADALRAVGTPVLVIGSVADPLHPEQVARDTAAAFPHGRLELVDSFAPLITHRSALRALLVEFLTG